MLLLLTDVYGRCGGWTPAGDGILWLTSLGSCLPESPAFLQWKRKHSPLSGLWTDWNTSRTHPGDHKALQLLGNMKDANGRTCVWEVSVRHTSSTVPAYVGSLHLVLQLNRKSKQTIFMQEKVCNIPVCLTGFHLALFPSQLSWPLALKVTAMFSTLLVMHWWVWWWCADSPRRWFKYTGREMCIVAIQSKEIIGIMSVFGKTSMTSIFFSKLNLQNIVYFKHFYFLLFFCLVLHLEEGDWTSCKLKLQTLKL